MFVQCFFIRKILLVLVIYGFGTIIVYASIVAQAALVEKAQKQLWMGAFQATQNIAGVCGGLLGGVLFEYTNLRVWEEMLGCVLVMVSLQVVIFPYLYSFEEEQEILQESSKRKFRLLSALTCGILSDDHDHDHVRETTPLLKNSSAPSELEANDPHPIQPSTADQDWLGLVVLCSIAGLSFFIEGTIGEWGGIFLTRHWDCGTFVAVLGYVVEKSFMLVSSIFCDYICTYLLPRRLVYFLSAAISMIGLTIPVVMYFLPPTTFTLVLSIFGFGLVGLGMGLTLPIWYSMAGAGIDGFNVAQTVSFTSTMAMTGCLLEPLLIGNFSIITGALAYSYLLEIGLLIVMGLLGWVLPRRYFHTAAATGRAVDDSF